MRQRRFRHRDSGQAAFTEPARRVICRHILFDAPVHLAYDGNKEPSAFAGPAFQQKYTRYGGDKMKLFARLGFILGIVSTVAGTVAIVFGAIGMAKSRNNY